MRWAGRAGRGRAGWGAAATAPRQHDGSTTTQQRRTYLRPRSGRLARVLAHERLHGGLAAREGVGRGSGRRKAVRRLAGLVRGLLGPHRRQVGQLGAPGRRQAPLVVLDRHPHEPLLLGVVEVFLPQLLRAQGPLRGLPGEHAHVHRTPLGARRRVLDLPPRAPLREPGDALELGLAGLDGELAGGASVHGVVLQRECCAGE